MIWLWFPGLTVNTPPLIADPPYDMENWNDANLDYSTFLRDAIKLRNPDWVTDISKSVEITTKRSMNGQIRSYINTDRLGAATYTLALNFDGIRNERKLALEHFVRSAEGKILGYKDPDNKKHAVIFLDEDIVLTSNERAAGMRGKEEVEDEYSTITINLMIIRSEP